MTKQRNDATTVGVGVTSSELQSLPTELMKSLSEAEWDVHGNRTETGSSAPMDSIPTLRTPVRKTQSVA